MEVLKGVQACNFPEYEGVYLPIIKGFLTDAGKVINAIQNLKLGPDAIILATYPRSGTHWVYEMTNMLRRGEAEYSTVSRESVFLEGLSTLDSIQSTNQVVSTHLPFFWLPKDHVETGGKIIFVIRNPKDVAVSLYKFLDSCGLFLPDDPFEDFVHTLFLGKRAMYGGWFDYNKEFLKEAAVREKQIIVVNYEKLKKNTVTELRRLADFLGRKCEDRLLKEITEKCEFSKLKNADPYVREDTNMSEILRDVRLNETPQVYRKGEIGNWKEHFTVALNEEFEKEFNERMKNVHVDIEFE